jgi:Tfp pilus assembly PilM family ATPase
MPKNFSPDKRREIRQQAQYRRNGQDQGQIHQVLLAGEGKGFKQNTYDPQHKKQGPEKFD